jgi:Ser/Thr protein kinase RdoA (MazF antagonist)
VTVGSLSAAVAVAREHGLRPTAPTVLAAGSTTVVDLGPCVARITEARFGAPHEVAVAAYAAAHDGPVVPPATIVPSGPHVREGRLVSFWAHARDPAPATPASVGRSLRALHDSLVGYPAPLPPFGHGAEALAVLERQPESRSHEVVRQALAVTVPAGQPLHGDAALRNCVGSGMWIDFELTGSGPREADLASMLLRHRVHEPQQGMRDALAAYGPHDDEQLHDYLRLFTALTCVMLIARGQRDLEPLLAARLAWLENA